MRKTNILRLLVFILTISSVLNGRAQMNNYSQALNFPDSVVKLKINFSDESISNMIALFPKFTNLTEVLKWMKYSMYSTEPAFCKEF